VITDPNDTVAGADGPDHREESIPNQDLGSFDGFSGISVRMADGKGGDPGRTVGDPGAAISDTVPGLEVSYTDNPSLQAESGAEGCHLPLLVRHAGVGTEEGDARPDQVQVSVGKVEDSVGRCSVELPGLYSRILGILGNGDESA
jgi:hypothetical protein